MCDCVPPSLSPYSCIRFSSSTSRVHKLSSIGSLLSARKKATSYSIKVSQNSTPSNSRSDEHDFFEELKFQERKKAKPKFELDGVGEKETNSVQFDGNLFRENDNEGEMVKDEEVKIRWSDNDVKLEELDGDKNNEVKVLRRVKQLMKRSNLLAKQVISIQSALCLGFISQLWVDTNTWMVKIVEVRPNLLSGESERFLLDNARQVGDVVLIEDETVMENEFKIVGLDTLVGYSVVTPGRRDIGKVRGYTFNINSGVIESLELDSFGISIIPSSLVSTYALLVEDVLEVVSDTVVVHEAAASRIQRLTKGFWDGKSMRYSMDDLDNYSGFERQSEYPKGRQRRSSSWKPQQTPAEDAEENWDLPMDYL